ncbi:MAG: 30S ribosomal protein S17 [Bacteriovoracaceae bacterium]|nr:30S ribosomal protein S17 [Bacteriovoracaceae bacterium]
MKETKKTSAKKTLTGEVVSKSGQQSIVVKVTRKYKHGMYKKILTTSKKFHAHDEANKAVVGNIVTIIESRPYSKLKRWALVAVK